MANMEENLKNENIERKLLRRKINYPLMKTFEKQFSSCVCVGGRIVSGAARPSQTIDINVLELSWGS